MIAGLRCAITAVLVLFTTAGCGLLRGMPDSTPLSVPAAVAYRCSVDAAVAMKPIPAKNAGEPFLSMPLPAGWEIAYDRDSALVRGALVNTGLRANGFSPTAVITLADVSVDSRTAAQAIDTEHAGIAAEINAISVENGTLPQAGDISQ